MAHPGGGLSRSFRRAAPQPDELLAALPAPLLLIDACGLVQETNAAAELLLNMGRAGVVGRAVAEMIGHPLTAVPSDAPFAAYDLELVLPGGRTQRVDLSVGPLADRPGWRVVMIHALAPAHLAGRRGDRDGGKLSAVGAAAMLAHEIKNPLSAIRGAAQLLEAGAAAEGSELTRLIRDEVDRIAALIDRMEDFTDTRRLDLTAQNIHAILGHARAIAMTGFAQEHVIREIYDPSLPPVLGHRDALVQILINLLKNAAEATAGTAGAITLRTSYRHGMAVRVGGGDRRQLPIEVCVIDEGPGAPPQLAAHLFDPFVTSKPSGGGLGLALVDKLVADHGGMIEYAREGSPPRSVFRLLLARAPEPA